MALQILRDLRGLRVHVVHPPDSERTNLVEHLRRVRIGVAQAIGEVGIDAGIFLLQRNRQRKNLLLRQVAEFLCQVILLALERASPSSNTRPKPCFT